MNAIIIFMKCLSDEQLHAIERYHQRRADNLQRNAAQHQRQADVARKELKRRKKQQPETSA